jgi:hypothetical protein
LADWPIDMEIVEWQIEPVAGVVHQHDEYAIYTLHCCSRHTEIETLDTEWLYRLTIEHLAVSHVTEYRQNVIANRPKIHRFSRRLNSTLLVLGPAFGDVFYCGFLDVHTDKIKSENCIF